MGDRFEHIGAYILDPAGWLTHHERPAALARYLGVGLTRAEALQAIADDIRTRTQALAADQAALVAAMEMT